jgi:hypothetical protein
VSFDILHPLQSLTLTDEARASYADAKARWERLFAWAGGGPAELKAKLPTSGVAMSVDHWVAFSRKWDDGDADVADMGAMVIDLQATEASAEAKGYNGGAPLPPPVMPPAADDADELLRAAQVVEQKARQIPVVKDITAPKLGGPLSAAAWGAAWEHAQPETKGLIVAGGVLGAVGLGVAAWLHGEARRGKR